MMNEEEVKRLEDAIEGHHRIIAESHPHDILSIADDLIQYQTRYKELTGKEYVIEKQRRLYK